MQYSNMVENKFLVKKLQKYGTISNSSVCTALVLLLFLKSYTFFKLWILIPILHSTFTFIYFKCHISGFVNQVLSEISDIPSNCMNNFFCSLFSISLITDMTSLLKTGRFSRGSSFNSWVFLCGYNIFLISRCLLRKPLICEADFIICKLNFSELHLSGFLVRRKKVNSKGCKKSSSGSKEKKR